VRAGCARVSEPAEPRRVDRCHVRGRRRCVCDCGDSNDAGARSRSRRVEELAVALGSASRSSRATRTRATRPPSPSSARDHDRAVPHRQPVQVRGRGTGDASIYLRLPTRADYREKIWDHAAGMFVVEQAGGRVTDVTGAPLDFRHGRRLETNRGVIATDGPVPRRRGRGGRRRAGFVSAAALGQHVRTARCVQTRALNRTIRGAAPPNTIFSVELVGNRGILDTSASVQRMPVG
jgi:hypothetical protein